MKNTQVKIKYNNATNKMKAVQQHKEMGRMRVGQGYFFYQWQWQQATTATARWVCKLIYYFLWLTILFQILQPSNYYVMEQSEFAPPLPCHHHAGQPFTKRQATMIQQKCNMLGGINWNKSIYNTLVRIKKSNTQTRIK